VFGDRSINGLFLCECNNMWSTRVIFSLNGSLTTQMFNIKVWMVFDTLQVLKAVESLLSFKNTNGHRSTWRGQGERDWGEWNEQFETSSTISSYKGGILFLKWFVNTLQITLNETTLTLGRNDFMLARNDLFPLFLARWVSRRPVDGHLLKKNFFLLRMLLYKLFIWAHPMVHIGRPLFKSWL